jgi:hypothetical protein
VRRRRVDLPADPQAWTRETFVAAILDLYQKLEDVDRRHRPYGDGTDDDDVRSRWPYVRRRA